MSGHPKPFVPSPRCSTAHPVSCSGRKRDISLFDTLVLSRVFPQPIFPPLNLASRTHPTSLSPRLRLCHYPSVPTLYLTRATTTPSVHAPPRLTARVHHVSMRIHYPLIVFLLANAGPSDASLFARGTESLARAANKLHHRAAKRSAGLASDLRRAFSGMYAQELATGTGGSQRVYCVNNAGSPALGSGANSTSPANGTSSSSMSSSSPVQSATAAAGSSSQTSTKHSTSSTASPPATTSSAQSPWKLTKNYVRDLRSGAMSGDPLLTF